MDISNLATTGQVAPATVKPSGAPETTRKPAPDGNSLPATGQGQLPAEDVPVDASASQPSPAELQRLVDEANAAVQERFSDVKFSVSEENSTANVVVRIEDSETGELIRQIPSEEMLAVARALDKLKQGTTFEGKA